MPMRRISRLSITVSLGPEASNRVRYLYGRPANVLKIFNLAGLRLLLSYEQRRARSLDCFEMDDYTRALVLARKQRPR